MKTKVIAQAQAASITSEFPAKRPEHVE